MILFGVPFELPSHAEGKTWIPGDLNFSGAHVQTISDLLHQLGKTMCYASGSALTPRGHDAAGSQ